LKEINLDLKSKIPIYIQIRDQLRLMVATGQLKEGEQMPPVRDLAASLLINPNTVTKAYHELEREGLITTKRGMGTFVSERESTSTDDIDVNMAPNLTREYVTRLLEMGYTGEDIRCFIDEVLKKGK
jgi:GntR family transcriptional regulator